jgi:capsular polysaccharide transport system permease protein
LIRSGGDEKKTATGARRHTMTQQQIKIDYSRLHVAHRVPRFATLRTISAMILREMGTTYGRRPGGYLWAVLEPVGGILMMTLLFSAFMRTPPLGSSFAFFFATGFIPFLIFTNINSKLATALTYSRQLLTYPRVTIADALLARLILTALTQLSVAVLTLGGILLFVDTGTTFRFGQIGLAVVLAIGLGAGWGILNCILVAVVPIWQNIWSILTRPLMLLSGVIFIFDTIPQPFRDWLWYNPVIHLVGLMRGGFYPHYDAYYVSVIYVALASLLPGVIGLLFLRRYYRDFGI